MRYYDYDDDWPRTMTVAERRQQAREDMAKLGKRKRGTPVIIEGSKIATSFWGKAWCSNLERYSDYASRLPRGRSYVRNGQVVDLQITAGKVVALVSGTELYETTIAIAPVKSPQWKAICRDCAGSINSVVELLQGRLAQGVMDRVCRERDGLFPAPREIKLSCSCPDSARMCKHVAAVLYGVGARLDQQPRPAVRVARRRPERVDRGCRAGLDGWLRAGLRQRAAGRRHGGAVRPGNGRRRELPRSLLPPSRNRLVA